MRCRSMPAVVVVLLCFMNVRTILAQTSPAGIVDGVKLGTVVISGANPVIWELDRPGGARLVNANFWRVVWSPVGPGHVCYLMTGDGGSPEDLRIALVDNRKLFEYVTQDILGAIDPSFRARPFEVIDATFASSGDALSEWRETCTSERYKVELVWRDFGTPFQLDTPTEGGRIPFGWTSLFIPARTAEVWVNGERVKRGEIFPQRMGGAQSSSAFLAFSETWVKK